MSSLGEEAKDWVISIVILCVYPPPLLSNK